MERRRGRSRRELLDFRRPDRSPVCFRNRIDHERLVVGDCVLDPNPGTSIGARQLTLVVHHGPPHRMEWQTPGSDRLRRRLIRPGDVHINPGNRPFFQRWPGRPRLIALAFDSSFIDRVVDEAFGLRSINLQTLVGQKDGDLAVVGPIWRREMEECGAGLKLMAESMATIIALHLYRHYADSPVSFRHERGGLAHHRLSRVLDYIESHLADDLGLHELATVAGFSIHHFAAAFRESTGQTPYRYVLERRIRLARRLLRESNKAIAEIALDTGFADQSHFTVNFRKQTGMTPSRYRAAVL